MSEKKFRPFFTEYIRDLNIGAVIPSTRFIVRRVIKSIPFEVVGSVLEFGAGEGVMTRATLKHLRLDANVTAFEPNRSMRERLESTISDKRLSVVEDTAENADLYISGKKFDLVLASNPFSMLADRRRFLKDVARKLNEEGRLIIFNQHVPIGLKRDLLGCFREVEVFCEVRNIPPWAFIFVCREPLIQVKLA